MSVNSIVTTELVKIFVAYFLTIIVPPAIVFGEKLKKRDLPYSFRLMAYLLIGNGFVINLVLYLTLAHICSKATLVIFGFGFYIFMALFLYEVKIRDILHNIRYTVEKLGGGFLGRKTFRAHLRAHIQNGAKRLFSGTIGVVIHNPLEVLGFIGTIGLVLYIFVSNDYWNLGYTASDLPVHNYWINALGENKPFVAGVYPMGYHSVIFFLHMVFGIDTYVLLCHWEVVTIVLLVSSIMAFVGYVCGKHTGLSFGAACLFVMPTFVYTNVYSRFEMGIPQEYAHVFILPSLMFLLEFFVRRREKEEGRLVPSTLCWMLFSAGLSLTISIHFYGTVVLLIFCIGVGVAHLPLVFRKRYFFSLMKSGLLALLIAILPMGISLLMGNEFQGSMNWALGVIEGTTSSTTGNSGNGIIADLTDDDYTDDLEYYAFLEKNGMLDESMQSAYEDVQVAAGKAPSKNESQNIKELVVSKVNFVVSSLYDSIKEHLYCGSEENAWLIYAGMIVAALVCLIGIIGWFLPWDFARAYLSMGIGVILLWVILASKNLGIPSLMDTNRTKTFLITFYGIIVMFGLDFLLRGILFFVKKRWIHIGASMVLCAAMVLGFYAGGWIQSPLVLEANETNGAILSLKGIIKENKDFTYTIISANDENQMVADHGYHYELSTFLKKLHLFQGGAFSDAYSNIENTDDGDIFIPSSKVYIFIEKVPIDYGTSYVNSGQSISEEGAKQPIPVTEGKNIYSGENRWICMSKMYYWAKAYQELIGEDMRVYYEDDEFVCYEITQNINSNYNFAIDYGYNDCGEGEVTLDD